MSRSFLAAIALVVVLAMAERAASQTPRGAMTPAPRALTMPPVLIEPGTAAGASQLTTRTQPPASAAQNSVLIQPEAANLARAARAQSQLDAAANAAAAAAAPMKRRLSPQRAERLKAIGRALALDPGSAAAVRDWQGFIVTERFSTGDVNALIHGVLYAALRRQTEDLRHFADKVKALNARKGELRKALDRRAAAGSASAGSAAVRTHSSATSRLIATAPKPAPGAAAVSRAPAAATAQVATRASLEAQLNAAVAETQLANVELQTALQRQQQTLQTMGTVSKKLHDSAHAVIRKIGG